MNILLFDDHRLFSRSLKMVLENFPAIVDKVFIVDNPEKVACLEVASTEVDLFVMDVRFGEADGIQLGKLLIQKYPQIPLIFLTGFDFEEYRRQAYKMGAKGFFNKTISPEELITNISKIVSEKQRADFFQSKHSLRISEREKAVLRLLSLGLNHVAIGKELFISKRTVENHLAAIYRKLEVKNSIAAVTKAIKTGIISV